MCMCRHKTGKHNVNGDHGYCWNNQQDKVGVHSIKELVLGNNEELAYALPGRCGRRLDSHSYDLYILKYFDSFRLRVYHGGGDETIDLPDYMMKTLDTLSFDDQYWLLIGLYHIQWKAANAARDAEHARWRYAAATKKIKTRKLKRGVKVWIEA